MANLEFYEETPNSILVLTEFGAGEQRASRRCFVDEEIEQCKAFRDPKLRVLAIIYDLYQFKGVPAIKFVEKAFAHQYIVKDKPRWKPDRKITKSDGTTVTAIYLPDTATIEEKIVKKNPDGTFSYPTDAELEAIDAQVFLNDWNAGIYAVELSITLATAPATPVNYWFVIRFPHSLVI